MRVQVNSRLCIPAMLVLSLAACDSSGRFMWEDSARKDGQDQEQAAVPPVADGSNREVAASQGAPEATRPFQFPREQADPAQDRPTHCGFDGLTLPANVKVFAAGAYSGRELNYQIDQSGHEATQIDVAVNHRGAPVVLMLGAYEPTIWNIGWSPDTRIVAVVASGYHKQVIAGLPTSVPSLISSYDNKGACGYFYVSTDNLGTLNPFAQRVFNHKVDMVYPATKGKVVIGDSLPASVQLVTGTARTPESYRDTTAPLAGPAGLDDAVRMGLIREARQSDAEDWSRAMATLPNHSDIPPVAGVGRPLPPAPRIHNGYVVLKPFVLPAGLYGAHSATFFVPKGVPRPTGNLGHSRLYDFNTLTCAGATCSFD